MNSVNGLSQLIRMMGETVRISRTLKTLLYAPQESSRELAVFTAIFQSCSLLTNGAGYIGNLFQFDHRDMNSIKTTEIGFYTILVPIQFISSSIDCMAGKKNYLETFKDGVYVPISNLIRSIAERSMYFYGYLCGIPAQSRFLREDTGDVRLVSDIECRRSLNIASISYPFVNGIEISGNTLDIVESILKFMEPEQDQRRVRPPIPLRQASPILQRELIRIDVTSIDLLELDSIPEALHEDCVFSRFICPITHEPIRHPVGDPNKITVYERKAIMNWLALHKKSPVTNAPLDENQILEKPMLAALIEDRLAFYQKRIQDTIRSIQDIESDEPIKFGE